MSGFSGSKHVRAASRGFTLLEIMLAVTILGLVMVAVFGIWNTSLTAWKRGTAATESLQRGRVVLDTLEELARSIEFSTANPGLYDVVASEDGSGSAYLSFVTSSNVLLPTNATTIAGMRRVTLAMSRDQNGKSYLAIASQPALEEESAAEKPTWHVLSRDVVAFNVRYRHPRDGTWSTEWAQTELLPSAMQFTIVFAGEASNLSPAAVTRAVDLPGATYALEVLQGTTPSTQNTTNQIALPDINLSESAGGDAAQPGGESEE